MGATDFRSHCERSERSPDEAKRNPGPGLQSRITLRSIRATSYKLQAFVAIGERSDAVLSNGYASQ
jgi:hypothetical protein